MEMIAMHLCCQQGKRKKRKIRYVQKIVMHDLCIKVSMEVMPTLIMLMFVGFQKAYTCIQSEIK